MGNALRLVCKSIEELDSVAEKLLAYANDTKTWVFQGTLGAGKTTLVKSLAKKLRVEDNMSSPTFSIVNEYKTANGSGIYHLDLYRLNSLQEAIDIGIEDYLYSNTYCFIEWPEIIEDILPTKLIHLKIEIKGFTEREIKASKYE